ncbi:MAG: TusE/DsrC/DsvC family sulfur relay protein [Caldilineaceae bacterium]
MSNRVIGSQVLDVNEEGFLTDPSQWSKEIATVIAHEEGVPELTPAHWEVIDFCRSKAPELGGKSPTLRQITTGTTVTTKELFKLFPKGPAKKVAKIAGLGKPEGCV